MNSRIEELIGHVVGTPIGITSRLHGGEFVLMGNKQIEKFAKLIIEECAKISESVTPRHTECGNKISAKIRQFHGDKNEMV